MVEFSEAIQQIQNTVDTLLTAETKGGNLDGANIIVGYKTKDRPAPPNIFVICENAKTTNETSSNREFWIMDLNIVVIEQDDNFERGKETVLTYMSKSRKKLLDNKRLGLSFVQSLKSKSVDIEASEYEFEGASLFACKCTLEVKFWVNEY